MYREEEEEERGTQTAEQMTVHKVAGKTQKCHRHVDHLL